MNIHAAASAKAHRFDEQNSAFARDVIADLSQQPKRLSPKYFYDAMGSELFEQITLLPEYYPTRTELGILTAHGPEIARPGDGQAEVGVGHHRQHLALAHQVAGEEDDLQQLRELAGLEGDRAQPELDARAVDRLTDAGDGEQGEQSEPQEARGVGVPGENPVVPDDEQDTDEDGDRDEGPDQLQRCELGRRRLTEAGGAVGQRQFEFGLAREFMLPLQAAKSFSPQV